MPKKFRVKEEIWLATETARVKDIILGVKYWGVLWSHAKLRKELAEIGLMYSAAEIDKLNTALHTAGIVEDVAEAEDIPE
jgi:hypothetical protein